MHIFQFLLVYAFLVLALAACTSGPETTVSPTPLTATAATSPTATMLSAATAVQPTAIANANEGTTTPQPTEISPTPLVGHVPADQPTAPLPVQEELTFTVEAQLGGIFNAVAIDKNIVFLGIGPRFATVDIGDSASPRLLWQSDVLPDVVGAIAVQPGLAYLRVGTDLLIYDISDHALPAMVGTMSGISGELYPVGDFVYTTAADVSGIANQALVAIDVSDPSHPTRAGTRVLSSPAQISASEEVLFIASGGPFDNSDESTLQLVDRSDLERTFSEIVLDGDWSHRVATLGNIAYVVEDRLSEESDILLVLDVSDPAHPKEVTTRQMNIEHTVSGIMAADDTLFLLARSFPHTGCPVLLYFFDITDPTSPQGPAEIDPQSCFNEFTLAGDTLAATSERGLQIFDVSNPPNLALIGELSPQDGFIAVERVGLDQGLAYLQTTAGRNRLHRLQVLDVANEVPTLLNGDGLDLVIEPSIFEGLDVRGDRVFGLGPYAVDISDPANPRLATDDLAQENAASVFYWPTPAQVDDVLYTGLLSATPDGIMMGGGIGVVDISDPANPVLVDTVSMEGAMVMGLSTVDNHLIVISQRVYAQTDEATDYITRLQIFDISDPLAPVEVGRLEPAVELPEQVWDFTVAGDTVYAASVRYGSENEYKLYVLDISDPVNPVEIGRFELPGNVTKMVAAGDTMYMRLSDSGVWALNINDRSHPYLSGHLRPSILDFGVDGDLLYLASGDAGLVIVQVEK